MQNLEKRLSALEGEPQCYRTVFEMPDKVLETMLLPLCGDQVPTDDDLRAIAAVEMPVSSAN
jgi:hypothetical protein